MDTTEPGRSRPAERGARREPAAHPLLTIDELAAWLKLPKGTLYNWVHERRIPYLKLGPRLRFDSGEIRRWLETCTHREAGPPLALAELLARPRPRRPGRGGA